MMGFDGSPAVTLLALALAATFVLLKVRASRIRDAMERRLPHAGAAYSALFYALAILCVPVGFFLMEFPYNERLFAMDGAYVGAGMVLTAALLAFFFFAGQRTKLSLGVFLGACFAIGAANHFVAMFKGQPILPSDVAALQTAAEVSGGYVYVVDDGILIPLSVCLAMACLLALIPRRKVACIGAACNCAVAVVVAASCLAWFSETDIEEEYDCRVDVWSSLDSYRDQGMLLCFLQRAQQLSPQAPDDYTSDTAFALRSGAFSLTDAVDAIADGLVSDAHADEAQLPSVVVVMNETFSDLSRYAAIDGAYGGPVHLREAEEEALVHGDAYVSALGGGTCNSEFEFLTGCSTGLLGAGVYPYMLYSLENVDNLAAYLGNLGYGTTAIHPAAASNWRRDRVYEQLGFDRFIDISGFEGAQTRRGMVTDAETYGRVLQVLSEEDGPQFVFDVTIASHGGYTTGELADEDMVPALVEGSPDAEVGEYLGCIQHSDREFAEFLDALEGLDRPVVVCMFGDHQPGFADRLAEASEGVAVSDMGIEQAQQRYTTPYIIWTNSDELRTAQGTGSSHDTSLNYLAADVLQRAGVPLDGYFSFLLSTQEGMPAINLNGYQDAQGSWHWHGEESDASEVCRQLAIVQYDNLFNSAYLAEWDEG